MIIDFLLESFDRHAEREALVWRDQGFRYGWLAARVRHWLHVLEEQCIAAGSVVALEGDFSPNSVALFLALVERGCILVPLTSAAGVQRGEFLNIAEVECSIRIKDDDRAEFQSPGRQAAHEFYRRLRAAGRPGLVLFSSGSTGVSKAAVHDFAPLLDKFRVPRHSLRTISFLLYDHIGGLNTMLYTLANGGCLATVAQRTPDDVLRTIERHKAELLPTSPTFLNLILISEAWKSYDLSSLQTVSYGTEPMPESTLKQFHRLFPHVRLLQTYGLSELGILRSKSKSSDSLWMKIGGEGFQTRIVDGILQIKARSAMLGYLNAPSPFTDDGWFITGDRVEVDGEFLRILGRNSEIINVGGEKVYPAQVESAIQQMTNVADAVVYGEKNPITGNIVCARVSTLEPEDRAAFVARLKIHCRKLLPVWQVPVRVTVVEGGQHSARFKKVRRSA